MLCQDRLGADVSRAQTKGAHFTQREPYETDVQLPLYVLGPDVAAGRVLTHPTQHTDFAMTFIDLAGAEAHAPIAELDGMSMVPLLFAGPAGNSTPWRPHSFQQFHENCNTWISLRTANESHTSSFRRETPLGKRHFF